jgi:plastocyanin
MWYRYRWTAPAAALLLLGGALAGCAGRGTPPAGATEQAAHDAPAAPAAKAAPPAEEAAADQVVIDNFTFSPATVTVAVGARVTWVNHDDVPHTVTSKVKPRLFDSGTLDTDGRYSFVFTAPGTYDYFCAVHPHMTAKVVVK